MISSPSICCCPCLCGWRRSGVDLYQIQSSPSHILDGMSTGTTSNNASYTNMAMKDNIEMDQIVNHETITKESEAPKKEVFTVARACALMGDKSGLCRILSSDPWLLNVTDEFGRTLLMYACLCDRHKMVKWLLHKGAQLTVCDRQGRNALHWAVQKRSHHSAKVIVTRAVRSLSISKWLCPDIEGISALHLAARLPDQKCLKVVLSKITTDHSCATLVDRCQRSPVHWAAASGYPDHLSLILNHPKLKFNIDETDNDGRTPLLWAVACPTLGGMECVRLLLQLAPWTLSTPDQRGLTPVHVAVIANNLNTLLLLLDEYKCIVDVYDNNFRTPLHWATRLGEIDIVKALLEHGAKLQRDRVGATPLHYAAENNHVDTVELMLKHVENQDVTDTDGRAAFVWAVAAGMRETATRMLSLSSIDRKQRDKLGQTPVHIAAQLGKTDIVEFLVENGWSAKDSDLQGTTPLMLASARGHSRVVQQLVKVGASIDSKDLNGRTALHWSCLGGHAFICQLLVKQYGLNPNEPDNGGRTALHCAAFSGFIGCVSSLLQAGGDPSITDNEYRTPLHMSCERGQREVAALLLEWGSPVNAISSQDDHCMTPLDLALNQGHEQVAETLLIWNGLDYGNLKDLAATMIQAYYKGHKVRKELSFTSQNLSR